LLSVCHAHVEVVGLGFVSKGFLLEINDGIGSVLESFQHIGCAI
jgi:hypothetical protein